MLVLEFYLRKLRNLKYTQYHRVIVSNMFIGNLSLYIKCSVYLCLQWSLIICSLYKYLLRSRRFRDSGVPNSSCLPISEKFKFAYSKIKVPGKSSCVTLCWLFTMKLYCFSFYITEFSGPDIFEPEVSSLIRVYH